MGDAAETKETKRTFIVPTIKSFDNYDFGRAKTSCSLTWLVAKAFGSDSVPEELQEPFYRDQYEQEHLKPPVAALLLSAELYCRAGSLILRSDAVKPLLGHNAVIQALAQKGLYVTDQERLVTERDLCKTPIHMNSHLAMIDTLMMAYTVEMVSVERMLTCVQKYCPFLPEEDFPYDAEEAIITWINKVNEHLRDILTQQQSAKDPPGQETAAGHRSSSKWYRKLVPARYKREDAKVRPAHCLPLLDNLLKDNTDGCALASLLHFYCPGSIPLEDVCLKETMSLADSLYNLQLVQAFCKDNLNGCCHFSLEDMLYASPSIKSNYLVFLAELFWWFEVVKPSFVQPRTFDTKEPVQSSAKMSPISKHNLVERPASPEQPRPKPSAISDAAVIKRSSSLSYVDGCVGTWPKEKRSSAHGISFEIPFDDVAQGQGQGRGMARSVSTEGFGFKVHHSSRGMGRNLSFQPINGQGAGIQEEATDSSSRPGRPRPRNDTRYSNGVLPGDPTPQPTTPTMEEALKIIHDCERPHGSLQPVSGGNGFFLHGPDGPGLPAEPDSPPTKAQYDGGDADLNSTSTDMDTGIHVRTEDIQDGVDEDSSLKDYSDMDQDCEARSCPLPERERGSPGASLLSSRSLGGSAASSLGSAAIRMTSFAEQKFRKLHHTDGQSESGGTTPEPPLPSVPSASAAIATQRAVTPDDRTITRRTPPRDHTHLLASEMVQLKMKLEEKRRAIEAQKKKVEAAFTRHRQRMGRTAFLNVVRRKGGSSSSPQEAESGSLDGGEKTPSASKVSNSEADSWLERCKPDGAPPKSPVEDGGGVGGVGEVDLTDYTRSIERLNTSLGFLQTEMQRLAQQQEVIMQMRESTAWVIPPPPQQPSPRKQLRELRSSSVAGRGSVGSLSPILSSTGSPRAPHRSPAPIKRKSASFHVRTPRTPRPSELKVTPISRMLNTPQSVDSLPRLRRFSPSQTQTTSFAYLGHDPRPTKGEPDSKEKPQAEVPGEGLVSDTNPDARALNPPSPGKVEKTKQEEKKEEERRAEGRAVRKPSVDELEWPASGKPSQPATGNVAAKQSQSQDAKDLIEVPLSVLNDPGLTSGWDGLPAGAAHDPDQKMCCGFFYRDDLQGEEDIAQKRAALLEKRMRREKEMQQKKQQQEVEQEQKKEVARLKAEEERLKKEEEKARREYIKNEHLRKKQLKLMDDMDSVIRPRTPSVKQKKPRPKSMHRDSMESPKPPAKAATGSRPRGFSVSSLSLASLNLADNESVQSDKRTPRPDSAEGYLSPCPSVPSRNGENWENESTTSSAASNTEYTGPKLYREPSAKSNKYIIQNALAHCCLAGKVNEGQKNKILEIMEKTEPNNFLILFRDSGCQFRSLYTYCPETQEICKLTGIGPKTITPKMIEGLFKYNSDKKQFSHIPAKTMSASVDAITIYGHLWHTKKQSTPKKLLK